MIGYPSRNGKEYGEPPSYVTGERLVCVADLERIIDSGGGLGTVGHSYTVRSVGGLVGGGFLEAATVRSGGGLVGGGFLGAATLGAARLKEGQPAQSREEATLEEEEKSSGGTGICRS